MELEVLEQEIKKRIQFYEKSYEAQIYDLLDVDLHDFLGATYSRFFKGKNENMFRSCMISYFDGLINDVMCNNHLIINKELIFNNLFSLQLIFDNVRINENVYDMVDDLRIIFNIEDKTLTKHI